MWSFRKTTNHLGFSALARLSHDTFFVKKTGPTDPFFSEALIRLPVFIAGLLFIPALCWCCWVWGLRFGAVIALAAVSHPWLMRFGSDGRAYGLIMMGMPVMLGMLESIRNEVDDDVVMAEFANTVDRAILQLRDLQRLAYEMMLEIEAERATGRLSHGLIHKKNN